MNEIRVHLNDSLECQPCIIVNFFISEIIQEIIAVCSKCRMTLSSPRSWQVSCETCGTEYQYRCRICGKRYQLYGNAYNDVKLHGTQRIYSCWKCKKTYAYQSSLKTHIAKCDGQNRSIRKCKKCDYTANDAKSMKYHVSSQHSTPLNNKIQLNKSEICNKNFNDEKSLLTNEEKISNNTPKLFCDHCDFEANSKHSMEKHMQYLHQTLLTDVKYTCNHCQKVFYSLYVFERHVEICGEKLKKI